MNYSEQLVKNKYLLSLYQKSIIIYLILLNHFFSVKKPRNSCRTGNVWFIWGTPIWLWVSSRILQIFHQNLQIFQSISEFFISSVQLDKQWHNDSVCMDIGLMRLPLVWLQFHSTFSFVFCDFTTHIAFSFFSAFI